MKQLRVRSIAGKDFPVDVADPESNPLSVRGLKLKLVASYPELAEFSKLNLYVGGRKLSDKEVLLGAGASLPLLSHASFISLVCSNRKRQRGQADLHTSNSEAARGEKPSKEPSDSPPDERCEQLFADVLEDYQATTTTTTTTTAIVSERQGHKGGGVDVGCVAAKKRRNPGSIKNIVAKLPIPQCLEDVNNNFKELSVIVAFLYHQGLQPTLSGLHRFLPSFDEESLSVMATFAPGIIVTRSVSADGNFSDASEGKVGAIHGSLAETGMSLENPSRSESVLIERETIINLHVPRNGVSPRVPMQNTNDSQRLEWKTLTGSMAYGGLVFSADVTNKKEGVCVQKPLPSLIQGSRSSSQTIGPVGLESFQKGQMAREMKQTVLKWQSYFRQALIELVLILHDDFMQEKKKQSCEDHDPLVRHCWHPDFPLKSLNVKDLLKVARKNLARKSRLGGSGKSQQELKGTFRPCKCCKTMGVEEFVPHLIQKASAKDASRVEYLKEIPGRVAKSDNVPLSSIFCEDVAAALHAIGIKRLYSHQEEAVKAVKAGENVIVSTATASGKSVCYNSPIVDSILGSSGTTALYIFPTKALAQDQLRALQCLCKSIPGIDEAKHIGVYDGDTGKQKRLELMEHAKILICNPDILHVTILPRHREFFSFLSRLKYIVLDEAHAYRGVFGSHVALVIRRLRRILELAYNASSLQFFLSSATIANSTAHAQHLTGLCDWTVVNNDGSPCGKKTFLLWNPPLKQAAKRRKKKREEALLDQEARLLFRQAIQDEEEKEQEKEQEKQQQQHDPIRYQAWKGRQLQKREKRAADQRLRESGSVNERLSPIMEMGMLFAECVQHDLKCIAFCKTRKLSELVLTYARQVLDQMDSDRGEAIAAYRAGYSAVHRRAIEGSLFNGNLKGVAATNALELGIDVGALDVTLHLGFPGTVSSLWQQAGRAGRREQKALSIYVAFDGALDQFFMKNPEKLFEAPIEHASIDYQNPMLLEQHLLCAGYEYPLLVENQEEVCKEASQIGGGMGEAEGGNDMVFFGSTIRHLVMDLQKRTLLGRSPDCSGDLRWFYIGGEEKGGPSSRVNLRAIDETVWTVVDDITQGVVEEIEESKAFFSIYEGGVYMQQGKKFLVTKLDMKRKVASVRRADLKYYTSIRQHTDIRVTGGQSAYPDRAILPKDRLSLVPYGSTAQLEHARHSVSFVGFMKVWHATGQVFDRVDLNLPNIEYDTVCSWMRIPDKARALVEQENRELRAGVHAAAHALLNVLPLYLMCNAQDAGCECVNESETRWKPERLLIYDRQPGGTGISAQVQPLFGRILRAAYELVRQCDCNEECGCPNCVQHGDCPQYNAVLDKRAALIVLEAVLEREDEIID